MKMKKFLALILSLALFIGTIPAGYAVSAEDTITPATGTVEATSTEYFTLNRYNFNSDCIGSMPSMIFMLITQIIPQRRY